LRQTNSGRVLNSGIDNEEGGSVGGFGLFDYVDIFPGEEGHSDTDFFLIFLDHSVQEASKFTDSGRILLGGDISAQLAH
jgi:hypothetical protein